MSRTRIWLWIALLLSVGMNIGLLVPRFAPSNFERSRVEAPRMQRMVARLISELELTDEQIPAFKDRQRQFFDQTRKARRRVLQLQADLRKQLRKRPLDRARVDSLVDELGNAHGEFEKAFVDNVVASRDILDRHQQQRLDRFLNRLRQNHGRPQRATNVRPLREGPRPRARP